MSFKTHLLIVSVIIIVVYLAWNMTRPGPAAPVAESNDTPTYAITVIHASWGLNCPVFADKESILDKAYVTKAESKEKSRPHKDNVLEIVSAMCNGLVQCEIPLPNDEFSGFAPEDCAEKKLQVEYRCYAFDRPWQAQGTEGSVLLNCEDKVTR